MPCHACQLNAPASPCQPFAPCPLTRRLPADANHLPLACSPAPPQVEAGNGFSCVLSMQGAPYCFGDGSYDQLGDGFFDSSGVPVLVANPAPAPPAPPASPPPPPSPPPPVIIDESSGSTPAGAIVGGVVGGVAGEHLGFG